MVSQETNNIEQGSDEWFDARLGCVTASRISDMLAKARSGGGWGATRKNYMAQLICERLTGKREEGFKSAAMERGNEVEAEARRMYEFYTDVTVEQVGFIKHPRIGNAGASPDGLIGLDGGLEMKCPNTATHLETLEGKPIKREYILQMQFGMACTERKWWDFVSYDPRLPEDLAFFKQRVWRDDEAIAEIEYQATVFLVEIDHRIKSLTSMREAAE